MTAAKTICLSFLAILCAVSANEPTPAAAASVQISTIKAQGERKEPLTGQVTLRFGLNKSDYLGPTMSDGILTIRPRACPAGWSVVVIVDVGLYTSGKQPCPSSPQSTVVVTVSDLGVMASEWNNFSRETAAGRLESSALIANNLDSQLSILTNGELGTQLSRAAGAKNDDAAAAIRRELNARRSPTLDGRAKAWGATTMTLFGQAQGVTKPIQFDRAQNKFVMTPELRQSVQKYQLQQGFPNADGVLDYRTLSSQAHSDIGVFLRGQ